MNADLYFAELCKSTKEVKKNHSVNIAHKLLQSNLIAI